MKRLDYLKWCRTCKRRICCHYGYEKRRDHHVAVRHEVKAIMH